MAEGFKSFVKNPLGTLEYIVKHPGAALEGTLTSPLFWVSLVPVPIFAANLTWGAFDVGIGLNGFQGPSLYALGREAYSALTGGKILVGLPTANFAALGFTRSFDVGAFLPGFDTPAQFVASQDGTPMVAGAPAGSFGPQGFVTPAAHHAVPMEIQANRERGHSGFLKK